MDIKSAIYSQNTQIGYFSEHLFVKEVQSEVLHVSYIMKPSVNITMKSCTAEYCLRFLGHFMPLVLGLHSRNLSDEELVFGTLGSTKSDWLRNFITFTVRFVVHRSRGTGFRNPEIAEAEVTNMAKQKIRQEI